MVWRIIGNVGARCQDADTIMLWFGRSVFISIPFGRIGTVIAFLMVARGAEARQFTDADADGGT
jgi:hypothetical protein